jgi:hypothetical protein
MAFVRRVFTVERGESGRFVARDAQGSVVAQGATTCEVIQAFQTLICGPRDELTPWSTVVRFRPDGRVEVTSTYRRRRRPPAERTGHT